MQFYLIFKQVDIGATQPKYNVTEVLQNNSNIILCVVGTHIYLPQKYK